MLLNKINYRKKGEYSLWYNKNFTILWVGSILSNFGLQVYLIALPLLIYDLTQSALAMSTMRAIDFFPNIFIGLIAGVLVDRFSRKLIMSITTLLQIVTLISLILLISTKNIELWHLYILGFILSSAGYTFGNAHQSVIPQIVNKEQLIEANSKMSFANTIISMIGPSIAGMIIAIYSFQFSFFVTLVSFIILFLFVQFSQFPKVNMKNNKKESIWVEIIEGIKVLFENKILLTPTIIILFKNLSSSLIIGVIIFYTTDILKATEKEIGFMLSIAAIGGLLGSILVTKIQKHINRGKIFLWTMLIDIVGVIVLILSNTWWLVGISLFIRTFGSTINNIIYYTIRQEFTSNHQMGRVIGTTSMLMKLSLPLGLFLSGLWVEFFPITGLFLISGIITTILFIKIKNHEFINIK